MMLSTVWLCWVAGMCCWSRLIVMMMSRVSQSNVRYVCVVDVGRLLLVFARIAECMDIERS